MVSTPPRELIFTRERMKKSFCPFLLLVDDSLRSGQVCIVQRVFLVGFCVRARRLWVRARNNYFTRFDEGLMGVKSSVHVALQLSVSYLSCLSLNLGQVFDNHRDILLRDLGEREASQRMKC